MRLGVGVALCFWIGASSMNAQQASPGERLFQEHCALCHGAHGYDGIFANLALPRLPQAPDDQAMAKLIKGGIDGTDMPPAYGVTDAEIQQIIAYVRNLGRSPRQSVPGNASRGEQLYRAKGNCAQCHMLRGQGGTLGPDLSDIGVRRGPSHLRQSMVDPEADLPHGFLMVHAATKDGRQTDGVRLNEDLFSIQIRDAAGNLHSFWKADLSELRKEFGKSPMPSYRDTLTASELDDLVAFLVSLRGDL
jgi:cytochrome c oxidase cbb3-type subunit 3